MHTLTQPRPKNKTEISEIGPLLHPGGVMYRVWACGHQSVTVEIEKFGLGQHRIALELRGESGYFSGNDPAGGAGDLYKISIDGGPFIPDFASNYQPQGVVGPSMVVDPHAYAWQTKNWQRPPFDGQVIYECHLGTFTPEGTFQAAIGKLDYLLDLGITALEIMPVADWYGARNWGYDGVMLFAPSHNYGTPDDFRALIDACHARGLAVILDVVFNHLGPEGNFSHQYSNFYFHQGRDNPWGQNFNLDGPNSKPVRACLLQNIGYWLDEFRVDGFRMDATHAIHDPSPVHFLAEVAELVHGRGGFIIAEDERNAREVLESRPKKGWGFDAAWADDFHHAIRVNRTGEQHFYLSMFKGTPAEIADTIRHGWYYTGQVSPFHKKKRGTPCDDFAPQSFVYCITNHDQVGNRINGARFHWGISPAAYRAVSLFLCLVPQTPLLFMGQEWGASTPFLYFTDMPEELGRKIDEGRKREFFESGFITEPAELEKMAHPQDPETFRRSKLNWNEPSLDENRRLLDLYRAGLKLRAELFGRHNPPRAMWQVEAQEQSVAIRYRLSGRIVEVRLYLGEQVPGIAGAQVLLRSNAPDFAGGNGGEGPETVVTSVA